MYEEKLQSVQMIEFRNFKEKIAITKKYDHIAKMEVIDNKFIYVEVNSNILGGSHEA